MKNLVKKSYPVTGMSCAACAANVENTIRKGKGVKSASVNYGTATLWVEFDPSENDSAGLKRSLQSFGYDLVIHEAETEELENMRKKTSAALKTNTLLAGIFSVPVVILGMFLMNYRFGGILMMILSMPVVFWFGRKFFVNAFRQLKHGKFNMDTLVAMSTGIAWIFSSINLFMPHFSVHLGGHPQLYFEASSVIIFFILLGRLLEERAKAGTTSAIKKLIGIQPKTASLVMEDGSEKEVPVQELQMNDLIRVKPGDRIPVDGIILSGDAHIDESTLTGESFPVHKSPGKKVMAGTVLINGSMVVKSEKIGAETLLSHIIQKVHEALGSKPPVQKLADKVAGVFVPIVMIIAVVSFTVWMLTGGASGFSKAIQAMISVLIISCPCALGLATPTAVMVGIGKAAGRGILIRNAEAIELAGKLDVLIFDKTGTLTAGKPQVTDIFWFNRDPRLKEILLGLELQSGHPLAEAIVNHLNQNEIIPARIERFENIPGKGIRGYSGPDIFSAGNENLMLESKIRLSEEAKEISSGYHTDAKTVVYFYDQREILAVIAIADPLKPGVTEVVEILTKQGIEIQMLTGDNHLTAAAIATKAGIARFSAELLPGDKADHISRLQKSGRRVAMAGDGINDSQAMAQADLGIAMGEGSDIAMEIAQMTLVSSSLKAVPEAISLSRMTVQTIRQNLFWAFFYNIIAIPVAAGVLFPLTGWMLNPAIAGAAMALSSLTVVSNSLRLKYRDL